MKEQHFTPEERAYAEYALEVVRRCTARELEVVKRRKGEILDERRYFMDYFAELKDDEKKDLLGMEEVDTQNYLRSIAYLARLGRQMKEPYFAGFDFLPDDDSGDCVRCYLSIQTLRDPDSGEMITFDWRAPIASLYYESEPGEASFDAPDGKVSGILACKRRYLFKDGVLQKCTEIAMPSDDEMLSEALSRNAGEHMRTIIQTLQKEQHRIVRDYIEGITVISGCAGSGKSSVALHKAAYILYGFRNRMKDSELAIISPNDTFSDYISTVLPDLGEENIHALLPEDVVREGLSGIEDFRFRTRLEEAELIGEYGLDSQLYKTVPQDEEIYGKAMRICREAKSQEAFRALIVQYVQYLRKHIFVPERLSLTEELEETVDPEVLYDLFYSVYSELPLLSRTAEITKFLCGRYDIRKEENKEFIRQSLDGMMKGVSAPALYRLMYRDEIFRKEAGLDFSALSLCEDLFEDACAVAVLNMLLAEPEIPGSVFYLICDEAQDFTPIFLEVLRHRYRGCDMLFVGDADQIVFENTGHFAEDIKRILPRRPLRTYELTTNYRSTREIVSYAARILERNPAEFGSVRSGEAPQEISVDLSNPAAVSAQILRVLREMQESGLEQAAVLTRTRSEAQRLAAEVRIPQTIASSLQVRFLPVYLAKGLEFDGVVVWNCSDPYYETEAGRFVLYTACTRAMHRLVLLR